MQTLPLLTTSNSINDSPEFIDYLKETLINPLTKLGFNLSGVQSCHHKESHAYVHILFFEYMMGDDVEYEDDDIMEILSDVNDEQGGAEFSLNWGTLIIMLPGVA